MRQPVQNKLRLDLRPACSNFYGRALATPERVHIARQSRTGIQFLKRGIDSTVDDYVEAIDYVINIAGEDCVGIGTDFTQGYGREFFDWLTHDKGYARRLTDFGEITFPEGFGSIGDFPNLTAAMQRAGWSESRIRKVLGLNWLRLLEEVWGA